MSGIAIHERDVTAAECELMSRGIDDYAAEHGDSEEHGNPSFPSERIGFVALAGEEFVGTSTGLVSRNVDGYSAWFRITELVVVKQYRGMGVGMELLEELESKLVSINVRNVWLWAADYEASFFLRHGYEPFYRMEKYHPSGHARIGLQKSLGE